MSGVLIADRMGGLHLFVVLSGKEPIACSQVRSESAPVESRSPERNELNSKTIGIVGLGSVGAKIGMSLARMGVRRFCLVDHDVLLPENLERHALDWQGDPSRRNDNARLGPIRCHSRLGGVLNYYRREAA
jgi:hypothetical protein